MKISRYTCLAFTLVTIIMSCVPENTPGDNFEPENYDVSGRVEKGPFISGSTITIQPLDAELQSLGSLYSTTIQDNAGSFSFGSKPFETPYAELAATGYYFNEVEGNLSAGTLNLLALVDLSDKASVNVNILTHLKYQRVKNLIAGGQKFPQANEQAQRELLTIFGLQDYAGNDASTFSIAAGTDESAVLIAISSLMLMDRSEAELTEYLAKLCSEFGSDGKFSDAAMEQIKSDKQLLGSRLSAIKENIVRRYEDLGISVHVKDLNPFMDWNDDGIAGNESLGDGQEFKLETTELSVPNGGGNFTVGFSSPVPVYLTKQAGIPEVIYEEYLNLYDSPGNYRIVTDCSIDGDKLVINVSKLSSRATQSSAVEIYDWFGNVLGEVTIYQAGDPSTPVPNLGEHGQASVAGFASYLGSGLSLLNMLGQFYHYNTIADMVSRIDADNGTVSDVWQSMYRANTAMLSLRDADAKGLGVYQDYITVFNALQYYCMVVAWGDVPYILDIDPDGTYNVTRTPQAEILQDLQSRLLIAMENLDDKKNESLSNDLNKIFFVSKDVARILLANIYMYQGDYGHAEALLKTVIDNGFHSLDGTNYSNLLSSSDVTFGEESSAGTGGDDIILAFLGGATTKSRTSVSIAAPSVVPIMTMTDVVLSYAECLFKSGQTAAAEQKLAEVTAIKNISVSGDTVLEKIMDARLQLMLYTDTNFAFMKRNGFATEAYEVEDYRLLLPIPNNELALCPYLTQNPGY